VIASELLRLGTRSGTNRHNPVVYVGGDMGGVILSVETVLCLGTHSGYAGETRGWNMFLFKVNGGFI